MDNFDSEERVPHSDEIMRVLAHQDNISTAGMRDDLTGNNIETDIDSDTPVLLDNTVVDDVKHGVVRTDGEQVEAYCVFPLVEGISGDTPVFMDHNVLDDIDSWSYADQSMISRDALERVETYFRENTRDVNFDAWEEQLGMEGNELYVNVSDHRDAALLTYDGALAEYGAVTPGTYLDNMDAET